MEYLLLFMASFLSATLLPLGSEALLLLYSQDETMSWLVLLLIASLGNTAGACVNWWLGCYLERFQHHRWFPVSNTQLIMAKKHFSKYGLFSLLFSWLPIIGDPLCLIAGVLKVPFSVFLVLVSIGKTIRYFCLLYLVV